MRSSVISRPVWTARQIFFGVPPCKVSIVVDLVSHDIMNVPFYKVGDIINITKNIYLTSL